MAEEPDSHDQPRRVDTAAKTVYLEGLRSGLKRTDAAARAGFTPEAFYYARDRDPVFALAYGWAMDLSHADQRAAVLALPAPADAGDVTVTPTGNRLLQRRQVRRVRFDARRQRIFLDHFAGTADAHQACIAAGIGYSTFTRHRLRDPEFAAACEEALQVAYAALEAEAVRQRLEAQRLVREGLCPTGEIAKEFERVLQLLTRYQRRDGRIGFRAVAAGRQRRWTFEEAIVELDRRLSALGVKILPPPEGGW